MASKIMARLPEWDLTRLYRGLDDKGIDRDLKAGAKRAIAFAKRYRGRLRSLAATPAKMLTCLSEYEAIMQDMDKPYHYASLKLAESSSDPRRGALLQSVQARYLEVTHHLIFLELEISALPESHLKRLMSAPPLRRLRHYLERVLEGKPHRRIESEEKIFHDRNMTGKSAFVRLFDQEFALRKFTLTPREELTETQLLDRLYHPARGTRKAAAAALTKGLKEDSRRISFIFNTLAEDKRIEDRYFNYPTPEASRHHANEITQEIVDTMSGVVTDHYRIVHDFYRFKSKVLGITKLAHYDRYAPVVRSKERISFAEAKELVLGAFRRFDRGYAEIAERFFTQRWIDAAEREGKRGGAFCSGITPDTHPVVFINYSGSLKEVFTLAHELGHGIHDYLMRDQGYLNYGTPLTIAETASVFAEMLVFDHLRKEWGDAQRFFPLLMGKIEGILATVFRQISMYRFEQDFHSARRTQGELAPEAINTLWLRRQREMFGKSVEINDDYGWWWSYIPHFVHTPFYVYAYAFGELLTMSLYAMHRRGEKGFVGRYLNLLRAGSSAAPHELVAPLGVDLMKRSFWVGGVELIAELVEEAKSSYRRR